VARPRRFPSRGPRRKTTWVGPADQGFTAVASNTKVLIASFDAAAQGLVSPTLVRTRGVVSLKYGSYSADLDIVGAYGVAIVTDRAFAAGAASIPGPFTDAGWDGWAVWRSWSGHLEFQGGAAVTLLGSIQQEVDSKAMRKMTDDETLVLMAESQSGSVEISMPLRLLFKLA